MASKHFTPALFAFLRELEANNEKVWWDANKDRYAAVVRDPALDFITDFGERLQKLSPHFVADARTTGGSLMRPYPTRDSPTTRPLIKPMSASSSDTRRARTSTLPATTSIWRRVPASRVSGSGIPKPKLLAPSARRSTTRPAEWAATTKGQEFAKTWSLDQDEDEMLKRVPPGLDSNHPYADDLRMKSFIAGANLTQKQVTSAGFDEELATMFSRASRFTGLLCDALGLPS